MTLHAESGRSALLEKLIASMLIPDKVIFNSGSAILDPISQAMQKFGNSIGAELFLPKQSGKYFYEDDPSIPNGLPFYSTTIASSYDTLEQTEIINTKKDCPLRQYIEETVDSLHDDEREQPTCSCCPENHLHVFRLPFIYFLIDGVNKNDGHHDVIEILRTLKKHKIYTHSTNKNRGKRNLADKLIELSEKDFDGEETLRLVSIFTISNST